MKIHKHAKIMAKENKVTLILKYNKRKLFSFLMYVLYSFMKFLSSLLIIINIKDYNVK